MLSLVLALALATSAPSTVRADRSTSGDGEYTQRWGVLGVAKAPPLPTSATDALRVSSTPALGARGWIVELRTDADGWATGVMAFFRTTKSYSDWLRAGEMSLRVSPPEWARLRTSVDQALARGQSSKLSEGEIIVCTDGPGYVVERGSGPRQRWMSSGCYTDDPTGEVAAAVTSVALDEWCDYARATSTCEESRTARWKREQAVTMP